MMAFEYNYNCMETCKMTHPCKNTHCSANPKFIPVPTKKKTSRISKETVK